MPFKMCLPFHYFMIMLVLLAMPVRILMNVFPFFLCMVFTCSIANGWFCPIPCINNQKTSCPPGYRCDLRRKQCVKRVRKETCFQVGLAYLYNGLVSETVNGKRCQRWDSNTPHIPNRSFLKASLFPENSVQEASNYCRDPSKTGRPWCYTTDRNDRWDYCKVPCCKTSVTKDNIPCQPWNYQFPHQHRYLNPDTYPDASLEDASNFCRSPDLTSATPWCYITAAKRWEYCNIEQCPYNYCFDEELAWLYQGKVATTEDGTECQNWDSQFPHRHNYGNIPMNFPEGDVKKAKNYCRSPRKDKRQWCYTKNPKKRWGWCCVNKCSDF